MQAGDPAEPAPRSLAPDVALFLGGGVLVWGVVHVGVPALAGAGVEPLVAWMLLAPPCVFVPVLGGGLWLLRAEGGLASWRERLWLRRPSAREWALGLAALAAMGLASGAMFALCAAVGLDPNPPFARHVEPIGGGRLWIVGLWAATWPVNILGEELVWRGILLPRMAARLGAGGWPLNAVLWGAFHAGFGPGNLLVLVPTLVLVPWLAQRRRSTWLAVLLHAGLSGPGFAALALGLA
jgi:membrane protease YdiL (CAAX protease family)